VGPNWIIPKDYLPWDYYKRDRLTEDQTDALDAVRAKYDGDYQRATTDSVLDFVDLWEERSLNARPIIPLQPDHVEHYRALPDRLREFGYYSLGGIAKAGPEEQVRALQNFREEIGYGPQVHALGVGSHPDVIRAIRDDPALVDSVDISTPEQSVKNGTLPDKTHKQPATNSFQIARGTNSSTTRSAFMEAVYFHLVYCITPFCEDDYFAEDEDGRVQSGLQNW